jgi:hypothetical protein
MRGAVRRMCPVLVRNSYRSGAEAGGRRETAGERKRAQRHTPRPNSTAEITACHLSRSLWLPRPTLTTWPCVRGVQEIDISEDKDINKMFVAVLSVAINPARSHAN